MREGGGPDGPAAAGRADRAAAGATALDFAPGRAERSAPVLLTGATGRLGAHVARELVARSVPARALVRDPAAAAPLAALGIGLARGDLARPETLPAALAGVRAALVLTGDDPRQPQLEGHLAAAAASAGVEHLVKVSAHSAGLEPPVSFGRSHREAERRVEATGVPATIVRPTFFMQSLLLFAPAVRRGRLVAPVGRGRVALVDARDAAAVVAAALAGPPPAATRALTVTGPEAVSFADVAARLAAATGRPVRHVSPPATLARVALPLAAGLSRRDARLVVELFAALRRGAQAETTGTVERITGRPPRPLDAFLAEEAAAFGGSAATQPRGQAARGPQEGG